MRSLKGAPETPSRPELQFGECGNKKSEAALLALDGLLEAHTHDGGWSDPEQYEYFVAALQDFCRDPEASRKGSTAAKVKGSEVVDTRVAEPLVPEDLLPKNVSVTRGLADCINTLSSFGLLHEVEKYCEGHAERLQKLKEKIDSEMEKGRRSITSAKYENLKVCEVMADKRFSLRYLASRLYPNNVVIHIPNESSKPKRKSLCTIL